MSIRGRNINRFSVASFAMSCWIVTTEMSKIRDVLGEIRKVLEMSVANCKNLMELCAVL